MSLTIVKEPEHIRATKADELVPGTWFTDHTGQVYVIVLDDRTHEKRVLCAGRFYSPFIANVPLKTFEVNKVLQSGTLLQITSSLQQGGNDE